jgi:predicted nucleic acid-binding protein
LSYLLDTNVLSELFKKSPNPKVKDWLQNANQEALFVSVLTLGEIRKGVEKMAVGQRKTRLTQFLEKEMLDQFEDRILSVDKNVAETWGSLEAESKHLLPTIDALLAATAITHNLTLVTHNTKDFSFPQLKVLDPWVD